MLMRRWERARLGDGQLALIVGEPGLGKSRLIEEFKADCVRRRTPGWSGVARSFFRTLRCIRSPNGADNGLAVLTFPLKSGSPIWKTP
jgi:predicted ATPase